MAYFSCENAKRQSIRTIGVVVIIMRRRGAVGRSKMLGIQGGRGEEKEERSHGPSLGLIKAQRKKPRSQG
jgi:hypothetical protein